jgi:hypothetical protein
MPKWVGIATSNCYQAGKTLRSGRWLARMVCEEIGWTESQHARWLADTIIRTLLSDG